jgi:uncharacterized membrane protein
MNDQPLHFASIGRALRRGLTVMRRSHSVSIGYAGIFAVIGAFILGGLLKAGMSPMVIAAAGGFLLLGPVTLAGFFGIARAIESGASANATADDVFAGFHQPPGGLWAISLVCALLFMIFVTDAGILYSYLVGGTKLLPQDLLPLPANVGRFLLWTCVSGTLIAFLLFAVSAFSVPLLCERRATLVVAVVTSVRIVLRNLPVTLTWALLLSAIVMVSILLLPFFPIVMPIMAYASHAFYREALPTDC